LKGKKETFRNLLLVMTALFPLRDGVAQNPSDNLEGTAHIEWVSEYPSRNSPVKRGLIRKLGDIIFGKSGIELSKPVSIVAKSPESFMVLDQKNGKIWKVDKQKIKPIRINTKATGSFNSLVDVCSIPGGNLLFTDSNLDEVLEVDPAKKYANSVGFESMLDQPTGIAYSKTNNEIWVVETYAHRIVVLDRDGKVKRYIGSRGTAPGQFNFPTHIWIDEEGTGYVVDAMNFRIEIFDKEGQFKFSFGQQGDATGYFAMPKGIATDSYGNIYVADALFHTIQIFDYKGNFLYNFGKQGRDKEEFWMPSGIYIDDKDYIYVADSYNSRVQIFHLITDEK